MSQEKIEKFFNIIDNNPIKFAYDVETNGLDWKKCHICGHSVSDGKDAVYIPVRHAGGANIENIDSFERQLNKVIERHPGKIIMHHGKFDAHFAENHNIKIGDKHKDTMTRAALSNENKRSYSLAACAAEFPDIPQKKGNELYRHIAQLTGCSPTSKAMANFHLLSGDDPLVNEYAAGDTLTTYNLCEKQEKTIYGENLDVVEDMENKLTYVLQKMERRGVQVDLERFKKVKKQVEELQINAYSKLPLKETFEPINIRSGKDLKEYFEMCEIDDWPFTDPTERFPDGQPSFNKDYLETKNEGLLIIEARKYDHFINSFIEPFLQHVHNNKIHTTFNQTRNEWDFGAKPGRLSCNNPNLQQVPKRDNLLGPIYRSIFVPIKDFVFVEYDHSQAEPRLYAHYSGVESLVEGYNKTPFVDMHTIASDLMGLTDKHGKKEGRKIAKNLNLGILYVLGVTKLARKLKVTEDEARAIIKLWYKLFGKRAGATENFTKFAEKVFKERGYVRTILGRRARLTDPNYAYRAGNRVIQGSSADILKWKMVEINKWIENNNYDDVVHMLLNIHDALLFQIHKDYLHLIPIIGKMFASVKEAPFNLRVPFFADYHYGNDWKEASYGV